MNNKANFLLAFMAGGALGAAAGLLCAPDKGSRTRQKLAVGAEGALDALSEKADSAMETAMRYIAEHKGTMDLAVLSVLAGAMGCSEDSLIASMEQKLAKLRRINNHLPKNPRILPVTGEA